MGEYYYDQTERVSNKKRSLGMIILDTLLLVLSAISFVALSLTLVTSYYDPSISWIFPVVGLLSPAIYLASTLLALYWIIRWRWIYALLLILPLAVGAPTISHYAKIETSKSYGEPSRRGTIKILTYNAKHFIGDDEQSSVDDMNEFLDELRPDVICFQEFGGGRMNENEEGELLKGYNREKMGGLATFTRYKILGSSEDLMQSNYESGSAFWSDLLVGKDTVRLYNIHLHSTTITGDDNQYISNMEFIGDTLSEDVFKGMVSRFRQSSIGRASQADTIARSISQSPHRVIICGDFNDTPNSYAFRKISKGLQDAFREVGVGFPYTFRGFLNLLRIDYILVEEPIEVLNYQVLDTVKLSDHLPVTTTIKL